MWVFHWNYLELLSCQDSITFAKIKGPWTHSIWGCCIMHMLVLPWSICHCCYQGLDYRGQGLKVSKAKVKIFKSKERGLGPVRSVQLINPFKPLYVQNIRKLICSNWTPIRRQLFSVPQIITSTRGHGHGACPRGHITAICKPNLKCLFSPFKIYNEGPKI